MATTAQVNGAQIIEAAGYIKVIEEYIKAQSNASFLC